MPGPPPNGRSSTRRYGSVVKSRGFHAFTSISPRSCARPTTPNPEHCAMKSGNSVTTSMCIASPSLEIRIPIDGDFGFLQIHRVDELPEDERNHPLAWTVLHHHHIVGAGREQMAHGAERHALLVHDVDA